MRRAGVHDHVIMAISGHKTREMFKRYDTVNDSDLQKAIMVYESAETGDGTDESQKGGATKSATIDGAIDGPRVSS